MKKFLLTLMLAVTAMSMAVTDAQARRLGGGGSIGKQSQSVSRQAPAPIQQQAAKPAAPAAAPATAPPPKPASPWKGILGGALLGLGLGALMSHLGLGGAMGGMLGSILMIALLAIAVMFIVRMFRRNSDGGGQPAYAHAYSGAATPEIGSRLEPSVQPAALQSVPLASGTIIAPFGVPADFDVPAFLRNAKTYFIRLQAAWDKADINDIREFTTPEMFAELSLQVQERGASPNHTDVVSIEAEMLGVETMGNDYLASVKFSGMIKEAEHAPAEPFTEVWNLSKSTSGQGGWVLAGIQQLS
jgi:predicted lipid-binding transport protein (Tim44 family)